MKTQSFNNELLISQTQFMDIFSDIVITRSNDKMFMITTVFGNRSRVFKALQNPEAGNIITPVIVITRTGLSRDTDRVSDVNEMLKRSNGSGFDYNDWASNPMNIEFQLTIISKTQSDIERIIGNFIPFFNPDVYVRTTHPKIPSEKMNLQIHWSGDIDEEWPEEIEPDTQDLKVATTSFTMKTNIFAGTSTSISDGGIINDIKFTMTDSLTGDNIIGGFYDVPNQISFDTYYDKLQTGDIETEYDQFVVTSGETIGTC